MKVALVCMYYDYGIPERGMSYEYSTYYRPLVEMGHEVVFFDFLAEIKNTNKEAMNNKLEALIRDEKPEVTIFALYKDEFNPEALENIKQYTKTFCFFQDDTWRTEYTEYWAKYFDLFGTPDPFGLERYADLGYKNCMHVPFGSNEFLNIKQDVIKDIDVSFVGIKLPYRTWIMKQLKKAGINVETYGRKWKNGRVSPEDMVAIYNRSKINLNISNSISYDVRYLSSSLNSLRDFVKNNKRIEQQKARPFEVCGSGNFMLTYYTRGLEKYYNVGGELAIYTSVDELIDQIRYYLKNEEEREKVAIAGYRRTLFEHTFTNRFHTIIEKLCHG
ncbi:MAG: glycosyltransferase [Gammaproteobacteria bacterium]|nr:glycosyltransferase [Gammaproteobacteria bacterium]